MRELSIVMNYKKDFMIIKYHKVFLTGVEGIEPSSGVLETLILPMNYTPKYKNIVYLQNFIQNSIH